jgi:predicted acetyltransferase
MAFDVRPVRNLEEFGAAFFAIGQYFGATTEEEQMQRWVDQLGLDRMHAAFENGEVVGGAAAFTFNMTVPGDDLPTAGVSVVGVYPTHRRRGILRTLMRAQLDDVYERGEPMAALWASEEPIYGRFGYGLAGFCGEIALPHEYTAFVQSTEPAGTLRFPEQDEILDTLPPVFERIRADWPGMFSRNRLWWEHREVEDPPERRDGAGPKRWIVYEQDGSIEGFAVYRHKPEWEHGSTIAELRVLEALGSSAEAMRDLWGFLLAIDWKATVKSWLLPPDHPLFLLLETPRRLRYRLGDSLWVRLVDVGAALSRRSYSSDESLVLEVTDEFCPWNEGRWKLEGGNAERTKQAPDLRLPVQSLGSAFLGGVQFAALARAGRVEEARQGALTRADGLFRWDRLPWCPQIF